VCEARGREVREGPVRTVLGELGGPGGPGHESRPGWRRLRACARACVREACAGRGATGAGEPRGLSADGESGPLSAETRRSDNVECYKLYKGSSWMIEAP
jgi:hypothetical protein